MSDTFAALDLRLQLAEEIRRQRAAIAGGATDAFLARHPEWIARYGEGARLHGLADAGFHLDYLCGAIEANTPSLFVEYVQRVRDVLASRGIEPAALCENVEDVRRAVVERVPNLQVQVDAIVTPAVAICRGEQGPPSPDATPRQLGAAAELFLQSLLSGDRNSAVNILLEAARGAEDPVAVYVDVLQPALHQLGRLWAANRLSVSGEHLATAIAQRALVRLFEELPANNPRRGRALITGVVGEHHQLGAHIVADALESDGWDVRFLGTDMPHRGILDMIEAHAPALVGVGCTMSFNLADAIRLVHAIRERFGGRQRILLGGRAFLAAPGLVGELQADGMAVDVQSAVRMARAWSA